MTEWVDGLSFEQVGGQPDIVRDRYAQIVYRFFYGNRARARPGARRPASRQLPARRGRQGRVLRLRDGPRAAARLPAPRGADHGRDPRRRRARGRLEALRSWATSPASSPSGARGDPASTCATISWWLYSATSRCASRPRTSGAAPRRFATDGGDEARRAAAPHDAAAGGPAPAADGGPPVPDRLQHPRRDAWGALLRELVEGDEPVGELGGEHAEWLATRR